MEVRGGSSSAAQFDMCGRFKKAWIKGGFSWDSRFSCVASSFSTELDADARAVVTQYFPSEWTTKTIVNAPPQVREIAENTGGVRTDQRLFTGDITGRLVVFGLWWPWGDETTISFRVGVGGYVLEPDLLRLREAFGALD